MTNNVRRYHVRRAALALALPIALLAALLFLEAQRASADPTPPQTGSHFVVDTLSDHNDAKCGVTGCSLREAVTAANESREPASISFSRSGTIVLTAALPAISNAVTIDASDANITISGNHQVQVFSVTDSGALTLRNLTITAGAADNGAGVSNLGALTVVNSTFSDNHAELLGGAIYNNIGATLQVVSSSFIDNSSKQIGGAIANGGAADVTNSTFAGNNASGSAVLANSGTLALTSSTVTGNGTSLGAGPAIENYFAEAVIRNSIVANNGGGDCLKTGGTLADGGYNLGGDDSCFYSSTSKLNVRVKFDPAGLRQNGGPVKTLALLKDSAGIDAIPQGVNGCGSAVATDARGVARPQGAGCDIGAFELLADTGRQH
ncbi:MAG: choice-of-anchor Q domain-containing protein [Rudaea sp.]